MIQFNKVALRRGAQLLISNINWTIYQKQRIGLVGSNGSGKSSLFALLRGELSPDLGDLELPKQLKIAHVAQETPSSSLTALDYILEGDHELCAILEKLNKAEGENDGDAIAHLHVLLADIDGYSARARGAQLLAGLGFNVGDEAETVSSFSGGWRMRLNLAKALMARSDLLMLDEPTNHLDLDAVLWLESWLKSYQGTLLLISHDRDFLDAIVDHIAHVENQTLTVYPGQYSDFETQRAEKLMLQQSMYEKQQQKIKHLQSFIDRFKAKASKAKQAQSRVKALARMDVVCAIASTTPFQFEFKAPEQCPNPLLTIEKVKVAYDDHVVLSSVNLMLSPTDRIAMLGPNGAGKSSLIKTIAGELLTSGGVIERAPGLKIGYFAQHQVDHLDLNATPLLHLSRIATHTAETGLRTYLGSFGFVGSRVFDEVKKFSGGEKARLALALIVWQKPNLLLLDEPTNHLDMEMREALALALQSYEGAMILVSHDRYLLKTTTDQFYLVADKKAEYYEGDLNDYEIWLKDYRKKQALQSKAQSSKKLVKQVDAKQSQALVTLNKTIQTLEEKIARLEKKLLTVETALANPDLYLNENKKTLDLHLEEQSKIKNELSELEAKWLDASQKKDALLT